MQDGVFPAVGTEAVCTYLSCGGGGGAVEYMANIIVARSSDVRDAGWRPVVKDRDCAEAFRRVKVVGGARNNGLKPRAFCVRKLTSS